MRLYRDGRLHHRQRALGELLLAHAADERARAEHVPAETRRFGYYVLPWLHGDGVKARLDLKSDRQARQLLVQSAHVEDHADPGEIAGSLMADLRAMASWLGLDGVMVKGTTRLGAALKSHLPG